MLLAAGGRQEEPVVVPTTTAVSKPTPFAANARALFADMRDGNLS
jgi:hypothetical protein